MLGKILGGILCLYLGLNLFGFIWIAAASVGLVSQPSFEMAMLMTTLFPRLDSVTVPVP
jgi:hypothetical protein